MAFPASQTATHPDVSEDIDLVERVIQREQSALMALYARYGGAVYSLAYRVLQTQQLAEEVTQDVFMKNLASARALGCQSWPTEYMVANDRPKCRD